MITRQRSRFSGIARELGSFLPFLAARFFIRRLVGLTRLNVSPISSLGIISSVRIPAEKLARARARQEKRRGGCSLSARCFISFRGVFSRQIKPRFPLLSTRRTLSRDSLVVRGQRDRGPRPYEARHFSPRVLPTRPVQSSGERRKRSKENRRGHPGGIADSKVAWRDAHRAHS